MSDRLLKSIFNIALENGDGNVGNFAGSAFLLNYGGNNYVVTAWHCIRNIIKYRYQRYGIITDNNITFEMINEVIEKNISFGFTSSGCLRIPINSVVNILEKNTGNRADILVLCVDQNEIASLKNTNLSELLPLQLSKNKLIKGNQYKIAGFPDCRRKNNKLVLESKYLTLSGIEQQNVDTFTLEQGLLSFEQGDSHATFNGYSGGVVLDDDGNVLGMIIAAPDQERVVRFITSNILQQIFYQYGSKYYLTTNEPNN